MGDSLCIGIQQINSRLRIAAAEKASLFSRTLKPESGIDGIDMRSTDILRYIENIHT